MPRHLRIPHAITSGGRWTTATLLLLAVCLVAACSPSRSDAPTGDADASAPAVDEAVRQRVASIMRSPLRAAVDADHEGLVLQRAILEDAWVTFAEYERVMRAATACIEAEGFPVSNFGRWPEEGVVGPPINPGVDPTVYFLWIYIDVDDPHNQLGSIETLCRTRWSYWVEEAWEWQHVPSMQEQQAWLDRLAACMREKGLRVSSPPDMDDQAIGILEAGCRPWESA